MGSPGFEKVDNTETVFWPGAKLAAAAKVASARHALRKNLIPVIPGGISG